jgi:hypothetical protein
MNIDKHIKFSKYILGLIAILNILFGVYFSSKFVSTDKITGFIDIQLSPILLTLILHILSAYIFFKAKQHFNSHSKLSIFYIYSAIILSIIIFFPIGIYLLIIKLKIKKLKII